MAKVDLAKRRRIMQRSMKLGHCICDPRRPCPCDIFKNDGICPCAGEKPKPIAAADVRLLEHVHNAGCASKIAPGENSNAPPGNADLLRVLEHEHNET